MENVNCVNLNRFWLKPLIPIEHNLKCYKTKLIVRLVLRQKDKIHWPIFQLAELVFSRASTWYKKNKQQMTCKSTNLIYMIQCKRCKKQYIGETKRTLRERFTEHKQATNNPSHTNASAAVPTHFNLPDHSIEDMRLIPLELQPTLNTSRRKAREAYLIHRGQTLEPSGMNRRNER